MGDGNTAELEGGTGLDKGRQPLIGQSSCNPDLLPLSVARAIDAAPVGKCPRSQGSWLVGAAPGERRPAAVMPIRCKSWRCSHCSKFLTLAAYASLCDGIAKSGTARFMTLTDGSNGSLDVAGLSDAWKKLCGRLSRRQWLGEFAYSLELSPARGLLHLHCVMVETERGGGYIPKNELSNLAAASGFGKIVDIRLINGGKIENNLAAYLAPERTQVGEAARIARYGSKFEAARLELKSNQRVRPFRTSQKWAGGGLRKAEADLMKLWYGDKKTDTELVWHFFHESALTNEIRTVRAIRPVPNPSAVAASLPPVINAVAAAG